MPSSPDATTDSGLDAAAPRWSEEHIQKGVEAAEFFEQHQRRIEAEEAENQLIAVGIGGLIAVAILLARELRKRS